MDQNKNEASLAQSVPIQLSIHRQNTHYEPGSFTDGRKLGLAIGSGGGAGPVSLGSLASLQELEFLNGIDSMYGVSVGAINLAAFASRQIDLAMDGYDRMTRSDFIKLKRVARIMDMGILGKLLKSDAGLNTKAVVSSPIPINIGVTRLSGGISAVMVDLTTLDEDNICDVLLWGASIPGISGLSPRDKKSTIGNIDSAYADGGFSHLSAVDMAIQDGCSDVIYLSNQPYSTEQYKAWQVGFFGSLMTPYDSKAIPSLRRIVKSQISSRRPFVDGSFQYSGANITAVYPPGHKQFSDLLPTLLNRDPRKIISGFNIAKLHIMERLTDLKPEIQASISTITL